MELKSILLREIIKHVDWSTLLNLRLVVRFDFEAYLVGDGKRFIRPYIGYDRVWEVTASVMPNGKFHGRMGRKIIVWPIFRLEGSLVESLITQHRKLACHAIKMMCTWARSLSDEEAIKALKEEMKKDIGLDDKIYYTFKWHVSDFGSTLEERVIYYKFGKLLG
jgi:hypothetical protein